MLHLVTHVVDEYSAKLFVLAVVGPLAVPVDGLELFHEGRNGLMRCHRRYAQRLAGSMQHVMGHSRVPFVCPRRVAGLDARSYLLRYGLGYTGASPDA